MTADYYKRLSTMNLMDSQVVYIAGRKCTRAAEWRWMSILTGRIELIQNELANRVESVQPDFCQTIKQFSTNNRIFQPMSTTATQSKTLQEWIDSIQDVEIRSKVIGYTFDHDWSDRYDDMYDALSGSFKWDKTVEGAKYWQEVAVRLNETSATKEFDPDQLDHE